MFPGEAGKKNTCVEMTSSSWEFSAAANSSRPSASAAPGHDRSSIVPVEASFQQVLRQDGTALDSPGEVIAGIAAASAVLRA